LPAGRVSASHVNRVEREGLSCSHRAKFVLAGTMNPEEGALRPQFLDRFGLYVEVKGSSDQWERKEIIRRRLEYERNREEYVKKWQNKIEQLALKITGAKQALAHVEVSEGLLKLAAEMAMQGNCAGNRAEIAVIETARAIAAYDNRGQVTVEDIKQAAELALPHRVREMPPQEFENRAESPENPGQDDSRDEPELSDDKEEERQTEDEALNHDNNSLNDEPEENPEQKDDSGNAPQFPDSAEQEKIEEPGEIFNVRTLNIKPSDPRKRKGSGKRIRTVTNSLQGRYIRYTFPKVKIRDIAFDATLRAAAPFQRSRERNGMAVSIKKSDFREKVREKRTGSTILFIVDASSSMGVKQRMKVVKGAVLSLLNDAYQKRDKVGMIAFRRDSAQLMLGITRSVDLAQKKLKELPTGGKTPLASGLHRGYEILKAAKLKEPDMVPYMVLVSDGRANVSLNGGNPLNEALEMAKKIAAEGIRSLVIDTEKDFIKFGFAAKLACIMHSDYCKLEDLKENEIERVVRGLV